MKKLFGKILVACLIVSSIFVVSACSLQKDVNIAKIEVKENTIPDKIMVGEFDNAGIVLNIIYDDDSVEEMPVTTELIPEKYHSYLNTTGIYNIEILFKGFKTTITINIVEESIYTVNFYNGNGLLVASQQVEEGQSATAPTSELLTIPGFDFVGWDIDFSNITKDTNVYSIYAGIENTIDVNEIKTALTNAINKHLTTNSVSVWDYTLNHSQTNKFIHSTNINYHYDSGTQSSSAQKTYRANNSEATTITLYDMNGYEVYYKSDDGQSDTYNYYEYNNGAYSSPAEEMLSNATGFDIFNPNEETMQISYKLCNNKLFYIIEETRQEDYNSELRYNLEYTYTFTDNGLISVDCWREDLLLNKISTGKLVVDYTTVEFQENLIPDEIKNN